MFSYEQGVSSEFYLELLDQNQFYFRVTSTYYTTAWVSYQLLGDVKIPWHPLHILN